MGEAGRKINKTVNKVENVVGDIIEKPSVARRRQQQLASGPAFESGSPAVSSPPRQPAVKFESSSSAPAPAPAPATAPAPERYDPYLYANRG
jgi:hypothetical protein